jgi:hypothetical protein
MASPQEFDDIVIPGGTVRNSADDQLSSSAVGNYVLFMARLSNSQSPRNLVCTLGLIFALVCDKGNSEGEAAILQPTTGELLDQWGSGKVWSRKPNWKEPMRIHGSRKFLSGGFRFTLRPGVHIWIPGRPSGISVHWESISKCPPRDAKATARILADAGFGSARVEVGWGNLGYYALTNVAHANDYRQIFEALKDAGIRPLVLLNSNFGLAGSCHIHCGANVAAGTSGSTRNFCRSPGFDSAGIHGAKQYGKSKDGLSIGHRSGRQNGSLSATLPRDIPAGKLTMVKLKYHPFGGAVLADGTPNPFAEETLEGWRSFVATVCQMVKEDLGTEGKPDAGFDLEVWNEYTFGTRSTVAS